MNTFAIDIGGTKFSAALFADDRMIRRESRSTDKEGGRDWMLAQLLEIGRAWQSECPIDRCGIGFGGPVNFTEQRVTLSTHVGGWKDFLLPAYIREKFGIPAIMDNDANTGALGEAVYGAGKGASPVFYMTLSTGIGGGIYADGHIWRGADSYGGEIGHLTIHPGGPECLCGARGCLRAYLLRIVARKRIRKERQRVDAGPGVRAPLRGGPLAGPEGLHHAAEPGADCHWRWYQQGR